MVKKLQHIVPVILAGGKSRRMGSNKSFVTVGEEKLIEIVVDKVSALFAEKPLLVTNTPDEYAFLGLPMIADIISDMGPLGGIQSALRHSAGRRIFVFGCDMPFLNNELIEYMATLAPDYDVVMPLCDSARPEPLHAIYSPGCLAAIESCLERGERRVVAFLPAVSVRYLAAAEVLAIAPQGDAFININTPADLEKARRMR